MRSGDVLYVGHMGDFAWGRAWSTSPTQPAQVLGRSPCQRERIPQSAAGRGLLLANQEQYPYRVGVPESTGLLVVRHQGSARAARIGFLPIDGLGVHRSGFAAGRYGVRLGAGDGFRVGS